MTLSLLGLAPACGPGARRSEVGPILVYVVDALRPDRTSAYGLGRPTTPAAALLTGEAVTYSNAFSVSTWTRPSVAVILTSLLPSETATLNRWGRLDEGAWYLPEALRAKGWKTAAFVANGNLFDERLGFDRGFDVFRSVLHVGPTGTVPAGSEWRATARDVVEPVLKFIEEQRTPRFFVYVHVVDTHAPYVLEPSYRALFPDTSGSRIPLDYDRSARQADDQFQRIVNALRARGFWKAATVVYTADHGEEFNEHGGIAHGLSLYEEQLRVPLIVKYPDGDSAGSWRSDPVNLGDLAPTIAEICGLSPSPRWIGASLWRHRQPSSRLLYFTEDLDASRLYAVRRGALKVIVQLYPTFSRKLFDLDRDPGEQHPTDLPCGASGRLEPALAQALTTWRQRDASSFPSLRFSMDPVSDRCRATVDLSAIRKPFLTADDYCRWSNDVRDGRLVFPGSASSAAPLLLSTDDDGRPPQIEVDPGMSHCSIDAVKSRLMAGPTADQELMEKLKSMGYLQGG